MDRKARLAALAARAGRNPEQEENSPNDEEKKVLKFRNYVPKDESLEQDVEAPALKRQRQENDGTEGAEEKDEPSELDKALLEAKIDADIITKQPGAGNESGINIASAPKKVNWDLKRDIAKKINRLERRTQKAVVELLRQRLEEEAEKEAAEEDLD